MVCKRCGRRNPSNASKCIYCGVSFRRSNTQQSNDTNTLIIVLICILLGVAITAGGVLVYKNTARRSVSFGGGGGGGGMPPVVGAKPPVGGGPSGKVPPATGNPGGGPSGKVPPATGNPGGGPSGNVPPATGKPATPANKILEKKNDFTSEATQIQSYSDKYLAPATAQYVIDRESRNVYNKWDSLLNKVYNYLEVILPDAEFRNLEKQERMWIKEKEAAMNKEAAKWKGTPSETSARYSVGINYTKNRCYYLISLIK